MNWDKKNDPLVLLKAAQKAKFQKIRMLLGFEQKPVNDNGLFKPKKFKFLGKIKPSGHWTFDSYNGENVYIHNVPDKATSRFVSARAFGKALEMKGYKRLGSGAFSSVYAHPKSDRVIKVTRTSDNWIDYALWASKEGYSGNFAPKVYSFKKFTKGEEFLVSVVERMDKTLIHTSPGEDASMVSDLLQRYSEYGNTMAGCFLEELVPGFPSFSDKLSKNFGHLDIHDGNIMVRKDGTVCFTDPVSEYSHGQVKYNRLKAKDFTSLATAIGGLNAGRSVRLYFIN